MVVAGRERDAQPATTIASAASLSLVGLPPFFRGPPWGGDLVDPLFWGGSAARRLGSNPSQGIFVESFVPGVNPLDADAARAAAAAAPTRPPQRTPTTTTPPPHSRPPRH